MIDYDKYDLIFDADNSYTIGYKKEVVRFLKDLLKSYIDQNFPKDVLNKETERLVIVRDCKFDDDDLIRVENNDEEKSHIPTKPIARVKVLVPYNNGFSGKDVMKYLI